VILPARLTDECVGETHVLVAHPDQGEREFLTAALKAWGYPVDAAATLDEALTSYSRADVQIAVIDRSLVVEDLDAWQKVRASDGRRVALILTGMASDDRAADRFGREEASAALVPPFELSALCAAVRAGSKECV
jgi:DNA-binding response OmpR family regulator